MQPVPAPVVAEHVVVEPAAVAAPSMNRAACFVAAETYSGLREALDARTLLDGRAPCDVTMDKVPLTFCADWGTAGLLFKPPPPELPPPEQALSRPAMPRHANAWNFIKPLRLCLPMTRWSGEILQFGQEAVVALIEV